MRKRILRESIHEISEDPKLVRLATITTFVHSLLFIVYLLYTIITLSGTSTSKTSMIGKLINEFAGLFESGGSTLVVLIIIAIILGIAYYILPPIGDGAMISYLASEKKSGSASMGKGFVKFVPMLEYSAISSVVNLLTWGVGTSRMYIYGILNNGLTIAIVIIWLIASIMALVMLPYGKMLIALKDSSYFNAMRDSANLAIQHFGITVKFVAVNVFLYLRFIVNIIIVIGIPLGLLYLATVLGILDSDVTQGFILFVVIGLILISAYINGIIEAFFVTYWYKVYQKIMGEEAEGGE